MTNDNNTRPDRNLVYEREDTHRVLEIPGAVGPNGCPLWYMSDGAIAELIPDEEDATVTHAQTIVRAADELLLAYESLHELVWYHRHQTSLHQGDWDRPLTSTESVIFAQAQKEAQRIRETRTKEELKMVEANYDLVSGRMSALAWVLGAEWEDSLDT